jgi:eukaryotic-like serine/threonine-protein kinase
MAQHGRYTVVRKLANGGMAEIFLASQQGHEGFQKPVVLKRILGSIYSDPQFRNMLIDEAHISMSLTHSNIVQVLDLGLAGGRYFLVLELVDGWDLGRILHRARATGFGLPRELGLFIVTEICRALAYAHGKRAADGQPLGIVHRDVSPNNVLISEHGEVKLADFGIAKAMNKREHTGTGVVKGKVAFMSPEQGLGKSIDARSDIFSLGTLLYLVSVDVKPFDASTDLETLLRVQRADFTAPLGVRPDLAPELAGIISRAMKFSVDERYQTAEEMLLDLERHLRSFQGGVGQTELKQYLAELGRRDGVPPIGRAAPLLDDQASRSGAELVEGNAVVLADAGDDGAEERTDLAAFMAGDGESAPRFMRRSSDVGRGASSEVIEGLELTPPRSGRRIVERVEFAGSEPTLGRSGRRPIEELSIPEGADDGPPGRYRRPKRRVLPTFLVLVLLAAGGYGAARYFGYVGHFGDSGWRDKIMGTLGAPPGATTRPAVPAAPAPAVPMPAPVLPATPPGETATGGPAPSPSPTASGAPAAKPEPVVPAAPTPVAEPDPVARAETDKRPAAARPGRPVGARPRARGSRDVFKASAKRVRSLSQGLDQLPPGTIQLPPPTVESPPPPPAP